MNDNLRKLHLGCFDVILPGWINTDITPHINISRIPGLALLLYRLKMLPRNRYEKHRVGLYKQIKYLNATKRFPYSDATIHCVFSSHMLEHLYYDQAKFCLCEINRVLVHGGIARISVPDLDKVIKSYDPAHPDKFLEDVFETKQKRDKNRHHWHYNQKSLGDLLKVAGFQTVYRCEYRQGNCPDVEMIDNRSESLFMEAIK